MTDITTDDLQESRRRSARIARMMLGVILSCDPHLRGECDCCRRNPMPLWIDPETKGQGDMAYCVYCWRKRARR